MSALQVLTELVCWAAVASAPLPSFIPLASMPAHALFTPFPPFTPFPLFTPFASMPAYPLFTPFLPFTPFPLFTPFGMG